MTKRAIFGITLAGALCGTAYGQKGPATPQLPGMPTPAAEKEALPDGFSSEAERNSYALGMFFAQRASSTLGQDGAEVNVDDVIRGLQDVLKEAQTKDYAFGVSVGLDVLRNAVDVDFDGIATGMREKLSGGETKLDDPQMQAGMNALRAAMQEAAAEKRKKETEEWKKKMEEEGPKNEEAGKAFMAENGKKEGVITTDSGLQYLVLEKGEGENKPKATDRVTVNYKGTLLDGTVFDESAEGKPATFGVNRVIKGWTEGLQLMDQGDKFRLWIPGDLAYGKNPRQGGEIGSMDTLIFDVELVNITAAPAKPAPGAAARPKRQPVTAVTPPVAVDIPPRKKEAAKPEEKKAE